MFRLVLNSKSEVTWVLAITMRSLMLTDLAIIRLLFLPKTYTTRVPFCFGFGGCLFHWKRQVSCCLFVK